ncbi:hypothetical protein [Actibacterium pelagium]|nr:hypothetical protein [Actibacterium pelagium]
MGVLFVTLALSADQASAHGGDGAFHEPVSVGSIVENHVEQGHPGHCHGGSFCGGVAVFAGALPSVLPIFTAIRNAIPTDHFRLLNISAFDPPPPRLLS